MAQKTSSRRYWLGGKRAAEQDRFFRDALDSLGWEPGDQDSWDAAWFTGMPDPAQFKRVSPQRKLNHFPGNNALTVKSRLHDSLAALRERMTESFGPSHDAVSRLAFFPRTYAMPKDYHALQQAALENPDKRWILKPTNASKGKGIRVLRDVAEAPLQPNWMVQEYLADPHTIRGHKYVLRLYVLVSSIEPLRLYLYRQGFAKLASEPYDIDDADNPYSQLTNPDINALNTTAEIPVEFIDLERYRQWLRDQGHDDEHLFEQIHDLIVLTVISAVDAMHRRTAECGADPQGCYELLGLDCMVGSDLKPWILECNLSPSLGICAKPESGGIVEEAVKGGLVRDMISLVRIGADCASEPDTHAEPSEDAARHLAEEAEAELARAGDYRRLFPDADPARYLPFFSLPRLADIQLADSLAGHPVPRPRLARRHVAEILDEDQLALYATHTGQYYRLNATASLIWLLATEGLDPDAIAEQLAGSLNATDIGSSDPAAPTRQQLRQQVWDTLAEWCRTGLLRQRGSRDDAPLSAGDESAGDETAAPVSPPCQPLRLACREGDYVLHSNSAPALARLSAFFAGRLSVQNEDRSPGIRLEILRDSPGYTLAAQGEVIASRVTLARLGAVVATYLARQAASDERPVIDTALLTARNGAAAICLFATHEDSEAMARQLASSPDLTLSRGLRMEASRLGHAEPLGLPISLAGLHDNATLAEVATIQGVLWVNQGKGCLEDIHRNVSTLDTLGALLPACLAGGGKAMGADNVMALSEWLSRCPRWAIETGEVADSGLSRVLQELLAESGEPEASPNHWQLGIADASDSRV